MTKQIDYGAFCVWEYKGPSHAARGFWHGTDPVLSALWAYAFRSPCGTAWESSRATGGFSDEQSAVNEARRVLAARQEPSR